MYLFLPQIHRFIKHTFHTLHSTMYLFLHLAGMQKLIYFILLYIPQCIYFYHLLYSGGRFDFNALHSTMYLFLPGRTLQWQSAFLSLHSTMYLFLPNFQPDLECFLDFLYIPQCIYFYGISLKVCIISGGSLHSTMYLFLRVCGTFYFTGGFTLHSTMYLFLRASQQEQIRYLSTFTFHNVSISTRDCLSRMVFRLSTLHSTMYLFLQR